MRKRQELQKKQGLVSRCKRSWQNHTGSWEDTPHKVLLTNAGNPELVGSPISLKEDISEAKACVISHSKQSA